MSNRDETLIREPGPATTTLDRPPPEGSSEEATTAKRVRSTRRQVVIFAVILALLAGASLVLLLTATGGKEVPASAVDVTTLTQTEVSETLLRSDVGPEAYELEILYAPSWYFTWSGRAEPPTDGSPTFAFFMFETSHTINLQDASPTLRVLSSQGEAVQSESFPVSDSPHHRASQVLVSAELADGSALVGEGETLAVEATWYDGTVTTLEWAQPLPYGLGVLNAPDTDTLFTMPPLSLGAVGAIFAGALAALAPCMLLLAAYYTAVMSGTASAAAGQRGTAERRLLMTGITFVVGFTAVYTAGGVIAGYVGESVGRFDDIGGYARPISIIAGVAVILLGIRMASQSRVPMVCKLPGFNRPTKTGWFGSAMMGATFAVGCLSCFSATVLTALLLYAGATGSPLAGGLVMLMFSAGVGVMFLIAALLVARAAPVSTWLTKAQPVIGAVSAVVMIGLGVLMVTYKFHLVTGYLFNLWS
jgi:cytochrome c-type biogenesis protein